jgi:hypothetical protein
MKSRTRCARDKRAIAQAVSGAIADADRFFFRQTRRVGHLGVGRQSWIRLVSALSCPSDTTNLDMELKSKNENEKYYVDLGTGSVFCVIIPGPTQPRNATQILAIQD